MLRKTLFVLGAGSSTEFDLPDGQKLATQIVKDLNIYFEDFTPRVSSGSQEIANAIRLHAPSEVNQHRGAAVQISAGLPFANSIDTFMESHKDDPYIQVCGKLAIVKSILEAEHKSQLYLDPNRNQQEKFSFPRLKETWISKLMRSLSEGISKHETAKAFENISFINFNYDRCVEQFFFHAMKARFTLSDEAAAEAMQALTIVHPYGTIGNLPWQKRSETVEYGQFKPSPELLLTLSKRIRTFTEGSASKDLKSTIVKLISEAELIVFLGFAYHKQNMQLLTPDADLDPKFPSARALGTAKGVSQSDRDVIEFSIKAMQRPVFLWSEAELKDASCSELLDAYKRTLFR
ncbi:MAG: hypothetical protein JNL71_04050 [Rhodospirillales bacterium]|nr:hypothetical protein [Rhodospirillales bacterium]